MYQEWRDRMDEREDDHPQILQSLQSDMQTHLRDQDDDGIAWTMLSECCYWLGEYSENEPEKLKAHELGVAAGERAVALSDEDVASHLWYAANMGSHGLMKGIMSSLFYIKPIEKHGVRALKMEEDFFYAAPLRLMGRFYHQCPSWPVGPGDKNKAIELLERAVDLYPDFLLNLYFLASVYLDKRKREKAKVLLETVMNTEDPEPYPMYQAMVQSWARDLYRDVGF